MKRSSAILVATLAAIACAHSALRYSLPYPSIEHVDQWVAASDATTVVATALRCALEFATAYIGITTLVALVLANRGRTMKPWFVPACSYSLARKVAGMGIAGALSVATPAGAAQFTPAADTPPVLRHVTVADTPTVSTPPTPAIDLLHVVKPGENLWSIAQAQLRTNNEPIDKTTVATYWMQLIDLNAHRLPPGCTADLLRPGVTLLLPPANH